MTRATERKFHYVYRIDRNDGKYYIGLHSTDILEDGYFGSGTYLSNSLRYHGRDKHSKTILQFFDTRDEAKAHEKFLITEELRCDPMCMNIAPGGVGGFHNEEHLRKFVVAGGKAAGKINGPANMRGYCAKRKADPVFDAEVHASLSKVVAERIAKHGLSAEFKHRGHSEATRKVLSEKAKLLTGEKNSQFGTCWVTDGIQVLKIKQTELESYQLRGFKRGRKIIDASKRLQP